MKSRICRLQDGEDVEQSSQSSQGLTSEEVAISRKEHGSNAVKAQQTPEWKKVRLLNL